MLTLHHAWASSASRRVRLCLAEKGLAYDSHIVDLARQQQHTPEYLAINPMGVVPALMHDGHTVTESGTICEYLDDVFPDPPLRPAAPFERARMRNWIRHIDGLIQNLVVFNWRHVFQDIASNWTDAELDAVLARIPSKERRQAWLRVARKPYTEEERAEARANLVKLLDDMETALAPTGWLAGNAYSIADIAAVPFIKRIDEEIAPNETTAARHPRVARWWAAIQARPAFAEAKIGPFVADKTRTEGN